ncbi:hypothetical protein FCH28_14720 [Streptomyces piniterrae]|uniref:Uncharacterized protein n=1 Tax=Streptomyces piniterrae TaxID=2571125 RepID=A0A4V5MKR9_9ACTN|nr:hypothetical protein [Streptomyces piniterrae]TJZ54388.1 hypothetical protein FCH28_14720 [Streptomyces piniterrae]
MNIRVLRIELKRSVAPWAGVVALATALGFLYLIPGPWWDGTALWTAQWTSMALWTRMLLAFLWPLAVGFGALQGLRDHRSAMSELLMSTPRPARHRAATLAGATAITLVSAFVLLVYLGTVQVFAKSAYAHLGWLPITLVGALSLVAGAVLGMGVGRAVPSPLTPPALAVAALAFTTLLRQSSDSAVPTGAVPIRFSLLSPAVAPVREVLLTLSASVHAGQTVWLLGMAATGFALLVVATPRARLLALAPVLAGAAIALLVLPSDPRRAYVVDEAAAAQVCDGPVCVTRLHQARLADLAGPGKEALRLLRETLGSHAPVSIREVTAPRASSATLERSRTAVLVDFDDGAISTVRGKDLTRALLAQGMAPHCNPRTTISSSGLPSETAAQSIAASWVLGDLVPLRGTQHSASSLTALAAPVWKELKALPRAEQRSRITAAHTAALSCSSDPLSVLSGGESP